MEHHDRRPLTEAEKRKISETFNIPYDEIGDPDPARMYGERPKLIFGKGRDNEEKLQDQINHLWLSFMKQQGLMTILLIAVIVMVIVHIILIKKL